MLEVVRFDAVDTPDIYNVDRYRIADTVSGFMRMALSPSSGHHVSNPPPLLRKLMTDVSSSSP